MKYREVRLNQPLPLPLPLPLGLLRDPLEDREPPEGLDGLDLDGLDGLEGLEGLEGLDGGWGLGAGCGLEVGTGISWLQSISLPSGEKTSSCSAAIPVFWHRTLLRLLARTQASSEDVRLPG